MVNVFLLCIYWAYHQHNKTEKQTVAFNFPAKVHLSNSINWFGIAFQKGRAGYKPKVGLYPN